MSNGMVVVEKHFTFLLTLILPSLLDDLGKEAQREPLNPALRRSLPAVRVARGTLAEGMGGD